MNQTMVILYDPFAVDSTIYVFQDGHIINQASIPSDASTLAANIAAYANATNIFSVKIEASPSLVEEIKQQLNTTNYTKQKIEVEGI